jgi:hypothetical protein
LEKAREFATLPEDTPVALVSAKTKPIAPQVAEQANPAAYFNYLNSGITALLDGKPQLISPLLLRDRW